LESVLCVLNIHTPKMWGGFFLFLIFLLDFLIFLFKIIYEVILPRKKLERIYV